MESAHESDDGTMTKEQLNELAEALTVLSAKSSIVKEREELKALMQDNIKSEQVRPSGFGLRRRLLERLLIRSILGLSPAGVQAAPGGPRQGRDVAVEADPVDDHQDRQAARGL